MAFGSAPPKAVLPGKALKALPTKPATMAKPVAKIAKPVTPARKVGY